MSSETKLSEKGKNLCIGIDLGTTLSVISWFNPETDAVEVIPNKNGERLTPSCVLFSNDDNGNTEILVGQNALQAMTEDNPVISHVKRFIGLKQDQCGDVLSNMDYETTIDHQGNPLVVVNNKKYRAEEISALVLQYLKSCAEEYLGCPITEIVLSVPAYFNNSQKQATKDACTIAGMTCLRLVPEPTCAALSHGLHKREVETVMVVDIGGGTTDVSILNLTGGVFEVIAIAGNSSLGGADIDWLLLDYIKTVYVEQMKQTNQSGKPQEELQNITQFDAEKWKKALSSNNQVVIRLPNFKYTLTRAKFEELITDFVEACLACVEEALNEAKLETSNITQIILVGGSSRLPLLQEKLKTMFGSKVPLNKSLNPDESISVGSAIQASILKNIGSKCNELLLLDVIPLSIGIEVSGGLMNPIIKRNSTLPCECNKIYSTVEDNQESVEIKVFQGERQFTKDCILLSTFKLEGLPRKPKGVPKIKVSFKMNCDGLLEVEALDKNTGMSSQITITSESNLTESDISKMIEDAEKYRATDNERRRALEEITRFEKYMYDVQRLVNLDENREILGGLPILSPINQYIINTLDWIMLNRNESLETIQNSRQTVEYNLKPHLDKMYSHKQELEHSGITIPEPKNQTGKDQSSTTNNSHSVENINDLIQDICEDALSSTKL